MATGLGPTYKWSSRFPVIKAYATATVNPGAIPTTALTAGSNGSYTTTVTVTHGDTCNVGDLVLAFPGTDLQGVIYSAGISASNTIKLSLVNCTGGSVTPASSTWTFLVFDLNDYAGVGI